MIVSAFFVFETYAFIGGKFNYRVFKMRIRLTNQVYAASSCGIENIHMVYGATEHYISGG